MPPEQFRSISPGTFAQERYGEEHQFYYFNGLWWEQVLTVRPVGRDDLYDVYVCDLINGKQFNRRMAGSEQFTTPLK